MGGWWSVMWLWMIFVWVMIVTGVWTLFNALRRTSPGTPQSAEEILKDRLARGEISHDEYDALLLRLRGEHKPLTR